MLIISQNGEAVTTLENGQIGIEETDDGEFMLVQFLNKDNGLLIGSFSDIDRAKQVIKQMAETYDHGNLLYKVPSDDFIEETCTIYVDEGNFLEVTRTGRVIRVAVQDQLLHGCSCQYQDCSHLGSCISSLSQLSVKNRRKNGTD